MIGYSFPPTNASESHTTITKTYRVTLGLRAAGNDPYVFVMGLLSQAHLGTHLASNATPV